jgi:chromosome segregation ATPase
MATDRKTELEVEKEAIQATLDELKKAFEGGEITEEDYTSSKGEYEERLKSIETELEDLRKEAEAAEAVKEEVVEEAEAKVDYKSMEWPKLREIAMEKGIPVTGKGVTREKIEQELMRLEEAGEAVVEEAVPEEVAPEEVAPEEVVEEVVPKEEAVVEEAVPEEVAPEEVVEEVVPEEVVIKKEIDPSIIARIEMISGEIPSLNSILSTLNMKKRVTESSLKVLKKNRDDGLVDTSTYNNLKSKYEGELEKINKKIGETETEIDAINKAVSEYEKLVKFHSDYQAKLKDVEDEISAKKMELDFIESGKLYIVSNLRDYLSTILDDLKEIEDTLSLETAYPDESFIKERRERINKEKENLSDYKNKINNFDSLIKSLEEERKEGEIDADTYSLLKSEYTKEKSRAMRIKGRIEGKLKMMEKEMEAYDKLEEAVKSCKSFIDIATDSFPKIWLEDEIGAKKEWIEKKNTELRKIEGEMSSGLEKMEEKVGELLEKIS